MSQTMKVLIRALFLGLTFIMAVFLSANRSYAMDMGGTSPEGDELMKYAHRLAGVQLQVLTLLDDMPATNK